MSIRLVLGLLGVFIVSQLLPSQSAEQDDARASQQFCRIVRMTLAARERHRANGDVPENDEFTAAAKACKNLEKTLAEGDSTEVKEAAQSLRPILALLGISPSTPLEQLAALEKKAAGLKGRDLFYELSSLAKRAFNVGEQTKPKPTRNNYSVRPLSIAMTGIMETQSSLATSYWDASPSAKAT